MPNVYDWLGDDKDQWVKSSMVVYNDLSGAMQYVGKTENEKTLRLDPEYVDWFDNTSGVQTLYIRANDKMGLAIDFSFMQFIDNNAIGIGLNTDRDNSDPNFDYHFFGSNPPALQEAEWRFAGQSITGLDFVFVIRTGVITLNGEVPIGTPAAFSPLPVTCFALQNTSIANTQRDLGYMMIQKQTSGS